MAIQLDIYSVLAIGAVVLGIAWAIYYEHFAN